MLQIVAADAADQVGRIRQLFREYNAELGVDLEFQGFDQELANLPGRYSPPGGRLLLAVQGEDAAGCVALRSLESGIAEMKRLYVRPAFRGSGVARQLVQRVIEEARSAGYHRLRLDTWPSMERARALYESLGFRSIPPYGYSPVAGTVFLELDLE